MSLRSGANFSVMAPGTLMPVSKRGRDDADSLRDVCSEGSRPISS